MSDERTRYDQVLYPGKSYFHSHPDRLEVQARLFGLEAAPVEPCRVLELGCGDGSNLIPMAARLPGSTFLGIDLAREPVAAGLARASEAKLANLRLEAMNIVDFPEDSGLFDYIISHGVLSWVPDPVREVMLRICSRHLAPRGVAYISYNVYPGWHLHRIARDVMRIHGETFTDPMEQVAQGKALVRFIAQNLEHSQSAYAAALREEARLLESHEERYLYHDFLSPENRPVLFRDFVARAAAHGLQYLGDASLGEMLSANLPSAAAETIAKVAPDVVAMEQYMDLVRGTGFRRSLLCRDRIPLKRSLSGEDLRGLRAGCLVEITAGGDDQAEGAPVVFSGPEASRVHVTSRLGKAALRHLISRAPREIEFESLCAAARDLAHDAPEPSQDVSTLGNVILHAYGAGLVDLVARDRGIVSTISPRPEVDRLIRLDAARGKEITTNRRHEAMLLTPFDREMAPLLDGTRDAEGVLQALERAVSEGRITVTVDGGGPSPGQIATALDECIRMRLEAFRRAACLAG